MATVQLINVSHVATVQKNEEAPVEMAWGDLNEAQHQTGPAGYVYRWLMLEYCRCKNLQRQGQPWRSPRREVGEIVADLQAREAREAHEADEADEAQREERQDAECRRRKRDEEIRRVEDERRATGPENPWWPIPSWEVPQGVRFDTPRRCQGQIVEVSYGTFARTEAGPGDPYMAVKDHSEGGPWRIYKRRG